MAAKVYIFPLDVRPTLYTAIGEYIARAALFEHQLITGIAALADIHNKKKRRISFMGMTFNARLGTFKALASYWADKRTNATIESIVRSGRAIRKTRNSFAHGMWGHQKGGDPRKMAVYFAPESKDYYLPKTSHYTADKIRAKAKSIRSLTRRLLRVNAKLEKALQRRLERQASRRRPQNPKQHPQSQQRRP